jgi:pimeloyl-ACP methyl ester carboxylesterase
VTQPAAQPVLIAVHGFMYDPKDVGGSNDPQPFFDEMSGIAGRPVLGFAWYSAPFGLRIERPFHSVFQTARSWLGSWAKGKLDPYKLAWDLAKKASYQLAALIVQQPGQVDLLAHSLGSRVVMQALWMLPAGKVGRIIFFDGAELCSNVLDEVRAGASEEVLNIAVAQDHVLSLLGARFSGDGVGECIGHKGLGKNAPPGWCDLFLDNPLVIKLARIGRGWTLRGDAPGDFLDHSTSYRFAGNVDLVRAWLGGDGLADLVGPR